MGIKNENRARQQYNESTSLKHTNFKRTLVGLVINPLYPHLGASPDGLISCDYCGDGVIKIKRPYSGRECHPKDVRGKLLNQVCTWFLEIAFAWEVSMRVCVCP